MVIAFVVLMIVIPILIYSMLQMLKLPNEKPSTFDKVALVGSLQVGLGMYLGFIVTFLGTAMSWLGVREAFSLAARAEKSRKDLREGLPTRAPVRAFCSLPWGSLSFGHPCTRS